MEKNEFKVEKKLTFRPYVSYAQLGLLGLFFLLGIACFALLQNVFGKETFQFSTISLIAFVLSVLLAGASIVLSISAIILGKTSEYAMILRSDESIRLQNEVFTKTTEALRRIEASTGVTEKRIEDIISGRVGDISHQIADIALQERGFFKDRKALEQEIKESILREIRLPGLTFEGREAQQKASQTRQKQYREFQKEALEAFSAIPSIQVGKLGDGNFGGSGDELFDGIFIKDQQRIAVSVLGHSTSLPMEYLLKVIQELRSNRISKVYFVFDAPTEREEETRQLVFPITTFLKEEFSARIGILVGTKDAIKDKVQRAFEEAAKQITPVDG